MADILRVTSPVINKNIIQPDKALKDPSVPFDMQEIRHITKNRRAAVFWAITMCWRERQGQPPL